MRTLLLILISIFQIFAFYSLGLADNGKILKLTIFTRDGTTVTVDDERVTLGSWNRMGLYDVPCYITAYERKGEKYVDIWRLKWKDAIKNLYSIEFLDHNAQYWDKVKVLVTNRERNKIDCYATISISQSGGCRTNIDFLGYNEMNSFTGKSSYKYLKLKNIDKIVFGTTSVMINPKNGRRYPPDYIFDPYDGTKLISK